MTPDASLVRDLAAYDPKLRIRWAAHVKKWFIERKVDLRNPQLAAERLTPPRDDAPPLTLDLWAGWREGYLHVLTVPNEMAHWHFIGPELARTDSWRQGGFQALNRQIDDENERWEAERDKNIDNWAAAASRDAHDHIGWFEKRTVSATPPPEPPLVDTGLGFKMRDRRAVTA